MDGGGMGMDGAWAEAGQNAALQSAWEEGQGAENAYDFAEENPFLDQVGEAEVGEAEVGEAEF